MTMMMMMMTLSTVSVCVTMLCGVDVGECRWCVGEECWRCECRRVRGGGVSTGVRRGSVDGCRRCECRRCETGECRRVSAV